MKSFDLWKKESAKRRFFFRRVRSNPQDHKNEIKKDEKKDDQNKKKAKKKKRRISTAQKNYRKSSSFRLNTVGKSEERKVVVDRRNGRERESGTQVKQDEPTTRNNTVMQDGPRSPQVAPRCLIVRAS